MGLVQNGRLGMRGGTSCEVMPTGPTLQKTVTLATHLRTSEHLLSDLMCLSYIYILLQGNYNTDQFIGSAFSIKPAVSVLSIYFYSAIITLISLFVAFVEPTEGDQ